MNYSYKLSTNTLSTLRITTACMLATVIGTLTLTAFDASAANERSKSGLVTNNQTYGAGNYYDKSSAERSNVHLRPLAIDPRHNQQAESRATIESNTTVENGRAVIVPTQAVSPYTSPSGYVVPSQTVETTQTVKPAWKDPAAIATKTNGYNKNTVSVPKSEHGKTITTSTTTTGGVIIGR